MGEDTVTVRWKNRDAGIRPEICTLRGVEFVARHLPHVLPRGLLNRAYYSDRETLKIQADARHPIMRGSIGSIRYYGLCHPAARTKRLRVQCRAGGPVQMGASTPVLAPTAPIPLCPCCRRPMRLAAVILAPYLQRGPPATLTTDPSHPTRS